MAEKQMDDEGRPAGSERRAVAGPRSRARQAKADQEGRDQMGEGSLREQPAQQSRGHACQKIREAADPTSTGARDCSAEEELAEDGAGKCRHGRAAAADT